MVSPLQKLYVEKMKIISLGMYLLTTPTIPITEVNLQLRQNVHVLIDETDRFVLCKRAGSKKQVVKKQVVKKQ